MLSFRYILWEAEDEGLELPYACRMGCCTVCAVRIKEGEMYQPESLGISEELRAQGYGLMCVGYPLTDLVLETVTEDEVYELQFGESFATQVRGASFGMHVKCLRLGVQYRVGDTMPATADKHPPPSACALSPPLRHC